MCSYLAGILLEITFGCPVKTLDDELVRLAERAISGMNHAGRAGSVPVDFVPICEYFLPGALPTRGIRLRIDSFSVKHIPSWTPGISFKRNAMVVRRHVEEYLDTGYNAVASAMVRIFYGRARSPYSSQDGIQEIGNRRTLHLPFGPGTVWRGTDPS